MSYNPLVNAYNPSTQSVRVEWNLQAVLNQTDKEQVDNAKDLSMVFTYLDFWLNTQRIETITYSSVSVWKSYVETYSYIYNAPTSEYILSSITSV